MLDELTKRATQTTADPGWDEVRSERVLRAAMDELRHAEPERRAPPKRGLWIGAAAAAMAAAIVTVVAMGGREPQEPAPPSVPTGDPAVAAALPPSPPPTAEADGELEGDSVLRFSRGSSAILQAGAQLAVLAESAEAVQVRQDEGRVRYEIDPTADQAFQVDVGSVRVSVLGTIFTVDRAGPRVDVAVERGRVRVEDGRRTLELDAGEQITVQTETGAAEPAAPGVTRASAVEAGPADPPQPATRTKAAKRGATPTAASLMAQADSARRAQDWSAAAEHLRQLVRLHPRNRRIPLALFSLGQVERARGRHRAAAVAFAESLQRSGRGPLAEDALAESAISWARAGDMDRAKNAAGDYLNRYSNGIHRARMARIAN